jgi:hypothetical protein
MDLELEGSCAYTVDMHKSTSKKEKSKRGFFMYGFLSIEG